MGPDNEGNRQEPPDYKVYRSRRRLGAPDLDSVREKLRGSRGDKAPKEPKKPKEPGKVKPERDGRPWLKWIGFAILGWLLLSFLAFAVSATIQKSKLTDMGDTLDSNPLMAVFPQNILVLGTDVRDTEFASADQAESDECVESAATGEATLDCAQGARADSIMVLRAGGGAFEKLSIPRDTLAAIPGFDNDKINAAYRFGGAPLMVETVEQLLGIDINHVAIVDFAGFVDLIDSLGGVDVNLEKPVCNEISGGTFKIDFDEPGEYHLNGEKALALARTRTSTCSTITDLDRTEFQQEIIQGMKGRLTDPLRIPINFLKGPLIGWNAPKAFVSDMGAFAMPQFVFAAAIGGSSDTEVLEPVDVAANPLIVPVENCVEAVRKLTGDPPERDPVCSPSG
jgi:LCP family protein required for cell wall assembly